MPVALSAFAGPLFVVIWSTGFIVARLVAPHADPLTFLLLRYAAVLAILWAWALATRARWPGTLRGWRDGLVAGVLLHGIYLGGVFWAVSHGLPAGISALIAGLQPLFTALLAGPVLGERVSRLRWFGIGLGFAGTILVLLPRLEASALRFELALLAVSLLSTLSQTAGTLWQKRTATRVDLRTNTVLQYCGAALVTLPVALMLEGGRIDPVPQLWFGLAWAVLGLSIGGVGLYLLLIRRGEVAGVAALIYLVPPVAALMSFALFGETLAPVQLVGMAVATVGVAVASRG